MGYLIGGDDDAKPQKEIVAGKSNYSQLTNEQLKELHQETIKNVTKYSNFQQVRKITLNSLYGALGNQYFRHYRLENAEAITTTGQVAIRWIERKVNEYLNKILKTQDIDYVIASDTDSIYIDFGPLVGIINTDGYDSQRLVFLLNRFCEDKLGPFIDESYDELSDYLQCYEKTLVMKRECIAEKGIWTAKKRYILNVWDNEGVKYEEPKLKIMGIEAVRSSTPSSCRKYIHESLKIIMSGTEDDLIEYIEQMREDHKNIPLAEIAFPRSANNIDKYKDYTTLFRKGTPMHIRATIMYNYYVRKHNLENKYNIIANGEKIKYVFMKVPNPMGQNVFAFLSDIPPEFKLNQYIDYDTMFEKGFIDPIKSILDVIGWNTEKTTTLESFFS